MYLNPLLSTVLLRQCWAPDHLAPAHWPSCQRLPIYSEGPSPITDAVGLIQLILPLPADSWLPSFDPKLQEEKKKPSCFVHVCLFH